MPNVFLISENNNPESFLSKEDFVLKSQNGFFDETFEEIENFNPDIIILDSDTKDSKIRLMELIGKNSAKEFEIFYLANENEINDFNAPEVKIILKPINSAVLINEIRRSALNKARLKELQRENLDLKKNLYQIDAFYNASSKFAGTLDKQKLYDIMFETLERVLSFDIACALLKDSIREDKLKFYINSLKKTTDICDENLIKRLALTAKNEGMEEIKPSRYGVETIKSVKPSYKNEFYDAALEGFDTLWAPLVIKDKFEGVIEVFRKTPFSKEDTACFQSIVHQVLAPLRSAVLYEDMIKTNEQLKKLERIKSEFVSIVSHELRTPLTPINNALSIILSEQGGEIGEVNKNFANIAKRNVSRLSGIIEDLLDLSRMQTGKFDFKFKKASVYSSLELVYNTFKNQAQSKNISFEFNAQNDLPEAYIDSHRIDQILSNLITNAIKFTPENGKIAVLASVIEDTDKNILINPSAKNYEGKYIKITVKDTGVGIEPDDIPKIFDKFSQIENSLSRNTGGIGLGLTISKYFIDSHLGGIWVESNKNEGSSFNFIIPVYSDEKAFEIELNYKIKNENETAYLEIEEKTGGENFYTKLKESNILKLTKHSKELTLYTDERCINRVFIPNLDRSAYEFMVSKIEEEINSKDKTCDIVLTKAYYKKEGN